MPHSHRGKVMNIKDSVVDASIEYHDDGECFSMTITHNGNGTIDLEGDSVFQLQKPEVLAAVIVEASTMTTPERDEVDWGKSLRSAAKANMLDVRFVELLSYISSTSAIDWAKNF